jgi:hypothetical protein
MSDAVRPWERTARSDTSPRNAHANAVILRALDWLRNHQDPEGTWKGKGFAERCRQELCSGPASNVTYDVGLTALALRAFLGAGHTTGQGDYRETVGKAQQALCRSQTPDGCFGEKTAEGHWIYCHCLATQAVCDALAWNRDDASLLKAARRAVSFLVDCQNPELGWRYGRQPTDNDTSCTAMAVAGLKAASLAGLEVPPPSLQGALNWLDQVTDQEYFKTGYTSSGDTGARLAEAIKKFTPRETMTAAAVACRLAIRGKGALGEIEVRHGSKLVAADLPSWDEGKGTIDMYYWYWGTEAMVLIGGVDRTTWEDALLAALLPHQGQTGCAKGSWDPVDAWSTAGGRVYCTAICALTLESFFPYRRELVLK